MRNNTNRKIETVESTIIEQALSDATMKAINEYIEEMAKLQGLDVDTYLAQFDDDEDDTFEQPEKEITSLWESLLEAYDDYYRFIRRSKRKTNMKYTVKRGR